VLRALSRNPRNQSNPNPNPNSNSRKRKRRRRRKRHGAAPDSETGRDRDRATHTGTETETETGTGTDTDTDKLTAAVADAPRPRDDSIPNKFLLGTDDDDGAQGQQRPTVAVLPSWPTTRNRNVSGYITPEEDVDLLPPSTHSRSRAHSRSNSRASLRFVCV